MKTATKYQVDSIVKAIKHYIEQQWPRTLPDLLRMKRAMQGLDKGPHLSGRVSLNLFPEPAAAIRLATDFNIPSVLPASFYILSTFNRESISGSYSAQWKLLDKNNLNRYYSGRSALAQEFVMTSGLAYDVGYPDECTGVFDDAEMDDGDGLDWSSCRRTLAKLREGRQKPVHTATSAISAAYDLDPLLLYIKEYDEVFGWDICSNCRQEAQDSIECQLERLWRMFPNVFDL